MNIDELLDQIEDVLESGKNMPFSSKALINAEEIKTCIEDIRMNLPSEISQAKAIAADEHNILAKANSQASDIVGQARDKAEKTMTDTKNEIGVLIAKADEITKKKVAEATEQANRTIAGAQAQAAEMVAAHEITRQAKDSAAQIKKQAQDEADAILMKAKEQADQLLHSAKTEKEQEVLYTKERADKMVADAEKWSNELRTSAWNHAEKIMKEANDALTVCSNKVNESKQKIGDAIQRVNSININ